MTQNNFIFSPSDSPEQKKKKIKAFFWGTVGIIFVLQIWPLAIAMIIFYRQIIDALEKAAFKKYGTPPQNTKTPQKSTDTNYEKQIRMSESMPTGVKTDQHQATLAIIGFIIMIVGMIAYYIYTQL